MTALLIHENILISGAHDEEVRLWQHQSEGNRFHCINTIKDNIGQVNCLQVLGTKLFVGTMSGIRIIDLGNLSVQPGVLPPTRSVSSFMLYENHLVVSYGNGGTQILDAQGQKKMLNDPTEFGSMTDMAGLESGPRVICGHGNGGVSVIELPSFDVKVQFQALEGRDSIETVTACPDGLFLLGSKLGTLQLWQRVG